MSYPNEVFYDFRSSHGNTFGWYEAVGGACHAFYCDTHGMYAPEIGTDYSASGCQAGIQLDRGANALIELFRFETNGYTVPTAYVSDSSDSGSWVAITPARAPG